jgi:hypothetical protein
MEASFPQSVLHRVSGWQVPPGQVIVILGHE